MVQHRVATSDIILGQPLPWDIYDSGQRLLLRKGHIVERYQQIEALMERGLFHEGKAGDGSKEASPPPPPPKENPSVIRLLNRAIKRLDRLLSNASNEPEFPAKILEVGKVVATAAYLDSDVALASIQLNQAEGRYPVRHCIDTAVVSLLIARTLKKSQAELNSLTAAALTMNIGMIQHQDRFQVLQGSLSEGDARLIKTHPQQSVSVLQQAGITDEDWLTYVLMHHENEDGSGYPHGTLGPNIPDNAKIISIADRYCARVSARSYRKAFLPNAALRDILVGDKTTIDPGLATVFIRELGIYPTGAFVRLENGEIAVVSGKGSTTTAPIVHSLIGPRGAPLAYPIKRDTSLASYAIRVVLSEEQANLRFSMSQIWGDLASL